MISTANHTHSVAHSQWNSSIIRPIVRAPTWIVVNHIATPVSAPTTKLTSTRTRKYPSTNVRASCWPRWPSRSKYHISMPPPIANCARNTWTMPTPPITRPFISGPKSLTG